MDRELGSLLELLNFPKEEGMGLSLAPGIFAMLFLKPQRCVMIFFDDDIIEPMGNFYKIEVILTSLNMAMTHGLADDQRIIVKRKSLEEALDTARIGLRRKDGLEINWYPI